MPIILISISLAVFFLLKILWLMYPEAVTPAVEFLALPAHPSSPWWSHALSPVTYIFTHIDFWHLLINSLWLAWFGAIFGEVAGKRWIAPLYLAGGCLGGAFYLIFATFFPNAMPEETMLVGASAATLAIIAATIIITPGRRVTLMLIGTFPLKWIAAGAGMIFLLASLEMDPGQTAAHIGGLTCGTVWGGLWMLVTRRKMARVRKSARERLDHLALIRKVRTHGYDSLSREEKIALFNLSDNSADRRAN